MKIFDPHNQISWDIMLIDRVEWFQFPFIATHFTIMEGCWPFIYKF